MGLITVPWYVFEVAEAALPEHIRHLFWEVSPEAVYLDQHRDYLLERVMSRGGLEA